MHTFEPEKLHFGQALLDIDRLSLNSFPAAAVPNKPLPLDPTGGVGGVSLDQEGGKELLTKRTLVVASERDARAGERAHRTIAW